jgi:hypothetical protein
MVPTPVLVKKAGMPAPLDLARLEQLAQAESVDAGIVRDHGQILDGAVAQGIDQRLGNATQAEAANSQQLAVVHDTLQGRGGRGVDLVHSGLLGMGSLNDTT